MESDSHSEDGDSNSDASTGQAHPERPSGQPRTQRTQEEQTAKPPDKQGTITKILMSFFIERPRSSLADCCQVLIQSILVAGAIYAICIYEGQLKQATRANNIATETRQVDERPWITIRRVVLKSPLAVNEKPTAYFIVKNSGRTPATYITANIIFYLWSTDNVYEAPYKAIPLQQIVLGPGDDFYAPVPSSDKIQDNQVLEDIVTRKTKAFYFAGWIDYCDIFGKKHTTRFCNFLDEIGVASTMIDGRPQGTSFHPCQTGNRIDDKEQDCQHGTKKP